MLDIPEYARVMNFNVYTLLLSQKLPSLARGAMASSCASLRVTPNSIRSPGARCADPAFPHRGQLLIAYPFRMVTCGLPHRELEVHLLEQQPGTSNGDLF